MINDDSIFFASHTGVCGAKNLPMLEAYQAGLPEQPSCVRQVTDLAAGVFLLHAHTSKAKIHKTISLALAGKAATSFVIGVRNIGFDARFLLVLRIERLPHIRRREL